MDELDLNIGRALSALATLVNFAERVDGSAKVPVKLLYEAKAALHWWEDSEYTTQAIRDAVGRNL